MPAKIVSDPRKVGDGESVRFWMPPEYGDHLRWDGERFVGDLHLRVEIAEVIPAGGDRYWCGFGEPLNPNTGKICTKDPIPQWAVEPWLERRGYRPSPDTVWAKTVVDRPVSEEEYHSRADAKTPPQKVYFIRCGDFIKIGAASDPGQRRYILQIGCPYSLELIAELDGGQAFEAELHRRFSHLRSRGEWFEHRDDLAAFIDNLPADSLSGDAE